MALKDLWIHSPEQIADKHVQQVIAFAGTGKLVDGGEASTEFRDLLSIVPSDMLRRYADECLTTKFDGGGLALQDVVNQVGTRLGFEVTNGRYRGVVNKLGFDGIWRSGDGKAIVVEVKTTDAYRIDLDTVAGYRRGLIGTGQITEPQSSMLIIVGREDTGDLEAQIRGSRHAWEIRLVSMDGLLRLMKLKEGVEDPLILKKIWGVLTPQEFTKVDGIIDLVFRTAEDVQPEVTAVSKATQEPKEKPVGEPIAEGEFREACVERVRQRFGGRAIVKQSRATYASPDGSLAIVALVSREYENSGSFAYWYGLRVHQKQWLDNSAESYVALGCGSAQTLLLIPLADLAPWLPGLHTTEREGSLYWHIRIEREGDRFTLSGKEGVPKRDISKYLLPAEHAAAV
jgi:hypothetical protein